MRERQRETERVIKKETDCVDVGGFRYRNYSLRIALMMFHSGL